jgi:hypothetical protein
MWNISAGVARVDGDRTVASLRKGYRTPNATFGGVEGGEYALTLMAGDRNVRVHALVGMHRSGTSWLAGSLQERGLAMGDVNESATYNAKGTRENDTLQAIHAGVLRDAEGTWRKPPRRIVWSDSRRQALEAFIADMNARHTHWGFKDPRTLFLLDEWTAQVPHLEFVGIFRHPDAVARSLAKRDFSPVGRRQSLKLWRLYNERLVDLHRRAAFPSMRFDAPPAELLATLEQVARSLDLPGAEGPGAFFDKELVHESSPDTAVPMPCRSIWKYLVEHSVRSS